MSARASIPCEGAVSDDRDRGEIPSASAGPGPPIFRRVRRPHSAEILRSGGLAAAAGRSRAPHPSRRRISSGGWSAMPRLVARPTSTVNVVTPDNATASGTGNAAKS